MATQHDKQLLIMYCYIVVHTTMARVLTLAVFKILISCLIIICIVLEIDFHKLFPQVISTAYVSLYVVHLQLLASTISIWILIWYIYVYSEQNNS